MSYNRIPLIKQAKHDIGLLLIAYKIRDNSAEIAEGIQKALNIVNHYCELQDILEEQELKKIKEGS